jgi:hypothetical protein
MTPQRPVQTISEQGTQALFTHLLPTAHFFAQAKLFPQLSPAKPHPSVPPQAVATATQVCVADWQTRPDLQVPQATTLPHKSSMVPQVAPCCWQEIGTHGGRSAEPSGREGRAASA